MWLYTNEQSCVLIREAGSLRRCRNYRFQGSVQPVSAFVPCHPHSEVGETPRGSFANRFPSFMSCSATARVEKELRRFPQYSPNN